MAALCTGIYNLSQNNRLDNEDKDIIFVKLTDSALRALEEFQKNKTKLGNPSNPSIQFLGNEGLISFPSSSNNNGQKFSFSISEIEGPQGSFECLQQSQGQLDILGALPYKMRIHANEDVYEATRHRMAESEENQKKKCTREIKPNQTDIGRKVKLKSLPNRVTNIPIPSSTSSNNKRDSLYLNNINNSSSNSNSVNSINCNNHSVSNGVPISTASTTTTTSTNLINNNNNNLNNNINNSSCNNNNINSNNLNSSNNNNLPILSKNSSNNNNHINNNNNNTNNNNNVNNLSSIIPPSTTPISSIPSNPIAVIQQHQQQTQYNLNNLTGNGIVPRIANINNNISNNNNHYNNNTSNSNRNQNRGNLDIKKKSMKDRLVHLLALRPYKKPELYARIKGEGVREHEKNCITNILKSISYMRDNTYHLHRHIWNDVQEDWPFYSEQDKQCLKRRKPQNLTPPLSSDGGSSTSGQSPTSTHNGSPPPAVKRPPMHDKMLMDGPAMKKQRISHFKKDVVHSHDNLRRSGYNDSREIRARDSDEMRSSNYYGSNVTTPNAHESEDSGLSLSYSVLSTDVAKRISSSSSSTGEHDQEKDNFDMEMKNFRENSNHHVNGNNDFSDFTRITTLEQRRQYKTEFDNDYADYRRLHTVMEAVSRRFAELEAQMRNELHNDQRYREIQRQILREYNENNMDIKYQESKERFNYLHQKLSHIKRLVNEYDTSITNNISRPQETY